MTNSDLPFGWYNITLGELCDLYYGKAFLTKDLKNKGFPVYGANGIIGYGDEYLYNEPKLIISCRGSLSGAVHITEKFSWVTSNSIIVTPFLRQISNGYLETALSAIDKSHIITGSAQPQITIQNLKNLIIPVPPIAEQIDIVRKVRESLAIFSAVKPKIEKIPSWVKQLKQKVFNEAANGHLSKTFRETNTTGFSGQETLDKLLEFRNANFPTVKLNLTPIKELNFDLPDQWVWTRLINIANVVSGVMKGRNLKEQNTVFLPYLRVANVQDGFLDLSEIKTIEALESDLDKYRLVYGDILFTEGGDRDKLGRGAIWQNEIENCIHQNHIYRGRTFPQFINPRYISIFTKSDFAKDYFYRNASQTVNLASINLTSLTNLPLPLPPLEEQNFIVDCVNKYLDIFDKTSNKLQKIQESLKKAEKLIYDNALTGKLTNTNTYPDTDLLSSLETARHAYNLAKNSASELLRKKKSTKGSRSTADKSTSNTRIVMKTNPVETLDEFVSCLSALGGSADPEKLLIASRLEDEIDLFYDLLREGRDKNIISVPMGQLGSIKIISNEVS